MLTTNVWLDQVSFAPSYFNPFIPQYSVAITVKTSAWVFHDSCALQYGPRPWRILSRHTPSPLSARYTVGGVAACAKLKFQTEMKFFASF